jgi:hypothetical protein
MSRLIAFGSSTIEPYYSFPAQIAKSIGREYVSRAKPVSSNHKIARMVLSYDYKADDFVLIDWTTTVRYEFRTADGWMGTNPGTYKPGCGFEEHWYQGPGQWEYPGVLSTLKQILLAQIFLSAKNISYRMTFAYDDFIKSKRLSEPDEYIGAIQNLVDWNHMMLFDDTGFLTWASRQNFVLSGGHAEQAAHDRATEYLLENFEF